MLEGSDGVAGLAAEVAADLVLNACVGVAGLGATLAALEAGIDVALANKESLVAGGPLVLDAARRGGAALIPVDSEHSALHQLLRGESADSVESLVLTASRRAVPRQLARRARRGLAPTALRHPTWEMGARITVDSATLMNKGLEVIEAHLLFGVAVRPHRGRRPSAVDRPRVRAPVRRSHARPRRPSGHAGADRLRARLSRPRAADRAARLDLTAGLALTFEAADAATFRCLALARAAGEAGGLAPCALNAADEEAVSAFLAGRCSFLEIADLVEPRSTRSSPARSWIGRRSSGPTRPPASSCAMRCAWGPAR